MEDESLFETLKYAVEIDQESLAQQLEEVRNQIDLTMGASSFAAQELPSASEITMPTGGIFSAPDVSEASQSLQAPSLVQNEQSF
jgi:hypothetical protein